VLEDNPFNNPLDTTDRALPESTDDYGLTILNSLEPKQLVLPLKEEKGKVKLEDNQNNSTGYEDLRIVGFKSQLGVLHRWEQVKHLKSKNIIVAPYVLTY